ncbi:MAG: hypothetical protein V1777_01890 [Candidatus Micrarchaeota archaeon]
MRLIRLISIFFVLAIAIDTAPQVHAAICGNNTCETGENSCTCSSDCGICGPSPGETCAQYECTPQNVCQKTNVSGCCGNGICEEIENYANCSTDCKPQKFDFAIIAPIANQWFSRGQTGTIAVQLSALDINITSAQITADGFFGTLEFFNDGKHNDLKIGDGTYGTFFKIPVNATEGIQTVKITAIFRNVQNEIQIPIEIKPQVTSQIRIAKNIFLGNNIAMDGFLTVGANPVPMKFDINLLGPLGQTVDRQTIASDANGYFSYSFRTSQIDFPGTWRINASGTDQNQNRMNFSTSVAIVDPNAQRSLEIQIINPAVDAKRGEEFSIIARVSDLNETITDAIVQLKDPLNRTYPFALQENGDYFINYQAPFDLPLGNQTFEITAKKNAAIQIEGSTTLTTNVIQKAFTIETVSPDDKIFTVGDKITFKFLAKYAANQPVLDANALLIVGNSQMALQSQGGGFYFAVYSTSENDIGTLSYQAAIQDQFANQTVKSGNIEIYEFGPGYYLNQYGIQFLAIVILASGILFIVRTTVLKKIETQNTAKRKQQLIELEKDIQTKYFENASIEKDEFEKAMESYEQELAKIEKKLGGEKK